MDLFTERDVSSNGSRTAVKPDNESEYIACPACAAQITLDRSPSPHIDECGFESYRFECQQCGASLACIIDPCDESLLVSQPDFSKQLRQPGDVGRDAPGLVARELPKALLKLFREVPGYLSGVLTKCRGGSAG